MNFTTIYGKYIQRALLALSAGRSPTIDNSQGKPESQA